MNQQWIRRDDTLTALVAGGAGFVGSHLCDELLARGFDVVCVDSLLTGRESNIRPLLNHPGFTFIEQDITQPVRIEGRIDQIYNLACAASPPRCPRTTRTSGSSSSRLGPAAAPWSTPASGTCRCARCSTARSTCT